MTNTIADITLGYGYINFCMGALISETGWENLTYIFLCEEVFDVMDITAEPTETADIREYKALLKYKALEQFKRELATAYDFSANGAADHRSQMFKQVGEMLAEARRDAQPYLPLAEIEQGRIEFSDDPYSVSGQTEHDA